MKGMSIFQTILLAVFGAIAIAAVLIFALGVSGNNTASVGPVTIWGTFDQGTMNAVLRAAADSNAQLMQVTYEQKNPDTVIDDLTNALAAGQGPDLVILRQDAAYEEAPKLIPIPYASLSQSQFENTFIDGAKPFLSESGVLGIPLLVDPLVLYWNKDLLGTAGFAKPPQYWDELYDMAQRITKRSDAGQVTTSAVSFGEYANVDSAKDILSMLILQAGGVITARDSSGKIVPALQPRTGDPTQATASALRFYTEFADPSKSDYTWNRALPESRQMFAAGNLGLYLGYASEKSLVSRMNPNLNFALTAMPQIRGGSRSSDYGRVYALAIPRTSKNPTGAVTVAYLLASSAISEQFSVALGIPSARRDVLAKPAQGDDDLFNKEAIITRTWIDPDPTKTADVFRAMIEETTSGASLLTEAVQHADLEMEHILGL